MAQRREPPTRPPEMLEKIRDAVRRDRDLQAEVASIEELLKAKKAEQFKLEMEELPELFAQVQMKSFTLEAAGNLSAFEATVGPYYHANIATDWSEEKRAQAFDWLSRKDPKTKGPGPAGGDNPDIIKTVITINLGRGERKTAEKIEAGLKKAKVPYSIGLGVPWNTLTAYVRELVEVKKILPPLDKLGAVVGRKVTVKPLKEKK